MNTKTAKTVIPSTLCTQQNTRNSAEACGRSTDESFWAEAAKAQTQTRAAGAASGKGNKTGGTISFTTWMTPKGSISCVFVTQACGPEGSRHNAKLSRTLVTHIMETRCVSNKSVSKWPEGSGDQKTNVGGHKHTESRVN